MTEEYAEYTTCKERIAGLPMPEVGARYTIHSIDEDKRHDGRECLVVEAYLEADADHDEEVLPMYRVQFDDGSEWEVFPEELMPELIVGHGTTD